MKPYSCKYLKLTFQEPCKVSSCIAHVSKFNAVGLNPVCPSNCIHVDFENQMNEPIDYAIAEQGRVGYRDLDYVSEFFKSNPVSLRFIYEKQELNSKRCMLICLEISKLDEVKRCDVCGYPKEDNHDCEERLSQIEKLYAPISSVFENNLARLDVYTAIWLDHRNKKRIYSQEEFDELITGDQSDGTEPVSLS